MQITGVPVVLNSLTVTDLTVLGDFNFGAVTAQDLFFGDDDQLLFGNTSASPDCRMLWETADADAHYLNLVIGSVSRNFIISEDAGVDWGHAAQTNPTIWIHSSDAADTADWLNLTHDQTDGVIDVGNGQVRLLNNLFLGDDLAVSFGNTSASPDVQILWETADADANFLSVVLGASRNIIISEDAAIDWTHAASTNPTLWIQSADSTTVADYISLAHNQTDAVIDVGAGDLLITVAGGNVAPSANDGAALGVATSGEWSDLFLASGGVINFANGNVTVTHATGALTLAGGTGYTITQAVATTGSPTALTVTGGAHTTLTASAEASAVDFDLSATVEFATGALTTQRAALFQAPTYGFVGASTLTTAATVAVEAAPSAGSNATITNSFALQVGGATSLASVAGLIYGAVDVPAHTVTITGTTQVTSAGPAGVRVGQLTLTDAGACTVDAASSIYIGAAPVAGGSVTLSNSYGLWLGNDDVPLAFGAGASGAADALIEWETADASAHYLGLTLVGGTNFVVSADRNVDWGHASGTDPRLWIQSADATDVSNYLSFYHDQTDANIDWGDGELNIFSSDATNDIVNIGDGNAATSELRIIGTTYPAFRIMSTAVVTAFQFLVLPGFDQVTFGANSTDGGRQFVFTDLVGFNQDHDIPTQTNPLLSVASGLNPATDNGEHINFSYLGLRAGNCDNADFSSSNFDMETDRATFDFTISAVNAYNSAAANANPNGGNLYLVGGNGAAADTVGANGGDVVVVPGTRDSGGNGTVGVFTVRQPGGVAGTDDLDMYHDGTNGVIESLSGALDLTNQDILF
jgi:hypothetical protein